MDLWPRESKASIAGQALVLGEARNTTDGGDSARKIFPAALEYRYEEAASLSGDVKSYQQ
jgi:hypothetical protein